MLLRDYAYIMLPLLYTPLNTLLHNYCLCVNGVLNREGRRTTNGTGRRITNFDPGSKTEAAYPCRD